MGSAASTVPPEQRAAGQWREQTRAHRVQHRNRRASQVASPTEAELGKVRARELRTSIMRWAAQSTHHSDPHSVHPQPSTAPTGASTAPRHSTRTTSVATSASSIESVDLDTLQPLHRRVADGVGGGRGVHLTSPPSVSSSRRTSSKKRLSVSFTPDGNPTFSRLRVVPKVAAAPSDSGARAAAFGEDDCEEDEEGDEFGSAEMLAIKAVMGLHAAEGASPNAASRTAHHIGHRADSAPDAHDPAEFDPQEMAAIRGVLDGTTDSGHGAADHQAPVPHAHADDPSTARALNITRVIPKPGIDRSDSDSASEDDMDAEELAIIAAFLGHAPPALPASDGGHAASPPPTQPTLPSLTLPQRGTAGAITGGAVRSGPVRSRGPAFLPPASRTTPSPGARGAEEVAPALRQRSSVSFMSESSFPVPDDWNQSEVSLSQHGGDGAGFDDEPGGMVEQVDAGCEHPDVQRALELIARSPKSPDAWKAKATGLRQLAQLVDRNLDAVLPAQTAVLAAVCPEVANPRAAVAKLAINLIAALCTAAGPCLDPDVERIVGTLLKQGGNSARAFITAAVEDTLREVAIHTSVETAFVALVDGLRRRDDATKALAAGVLLTVLDRFEAAMVPSFAAEVLPLLPPLLRSPERDAGLRLLGALESAQGWERGLMRRHLSASGLDAVEKALDEIAAAAAKRQPPAKHRSSSLRPSLGSRPSGSSSPTRSSASRRTSVGAGTQPQPQAVGKEWSALVRIKKELGHTTDWQQRDAVLGQLDAALSTPAKYLRYADLVFRDILLPLTSASNGKLQLSALEVTTKYISAFKDEFDPTLLAFIVKKVTPALASSNSMVFAAASALLDHVVAFCNPALLIKPWCAAIDRERNVKVQSAMLRKLRKLIAVGYTRRCHPQIEKHAIPAACRWLTTSVCPVDTKRLCKILFAEMEAEMLSVAESAASETQRAVVQFMENDLYE